MSRAIRLCLVLALAGEASAAPDQRTHVDPDAIREVRRTASGRFASGRAIADYLEGRRRSREGDWAGAAEAFRLAITFDEGSPELRISLAQALALTGRIDSAEGEARRTLELAKGGPAAAEAHVLLSQIAAARRQPEVAALELRQAIRIETALAEAGERPDVAPWRMLAITYLELGDEAAAWRALEDLTARLPGESDGFRETGRFLLERHEPGKAERHLRQAVELDRGDVDAWRLLAQAHEALGRGLEARDDLLEVLKAEPDDAPALLALGREALRREDVEAGRAWLGRYLRVAPRRGEATVEVVYLWLEVGRPADALQTARATAIGPGGDPRLHFAEGLALQALRRWPEAAQALQAVGPDAEGFYVPARVALAQSLSRMGRHAEAERALVEPIRDHPSDVRLVTTRAMVLERAGKAGEAAKLLDDAAAERDRTGDVAGAADLSAALAETLGRAGRAPEAVAALERAVAAHPRTPTLLYALGAAYERAGEPEQAAGQLRALLVLDPDHAGALSFLAGALADRGVQLDEAERLARRGAELAPRSPRALDALGRVLLAQGDLLGAIAALERADALSGPDPEILDHLGDAYRAAARPAEATAAWRRALAGVADETPSVAVRLRPVLERKLREVNSAERPVARERPAGAPRSP
jgi:tetratricopeptide (TPR) repeat protein